MGMTWKVLYHDAFVPELEALSETVQDELFANISLLTSYGPALGRPHADTLAGSHFANMKELRFRANNGVWRVAYAFDPKRQAIVRVAGDKSGTSQNRFYRSMIAKADKRFAKYLDMLEKN